MRIRLVGGQLNCRIFLLILSAMLASGAPCDEATNLVDNHVERCKLGEQIFVYVCRDLR